MMLQSTFIPENRAVQSKHETTKSNRGLIANKLIVSDLYEFHIKTKN